MCNAESKYTCMKMLEGSLRYTVLYFQWVKAHVGTLELLDVAN